MHSKIAIVASSIHPVKQAHLLEWYEDLAKTEIKCKLFLGSKNVAINYAENYKVNSKREKIKYFFKGKIAHKNQPLIDYNPDVIHLLTSNTFESIKSVIGEDTKLIVSFRGYDINVFPYISDTNMKLTLQIFERADVLHFISDDLKKSAIKLGANSNKSIVIYRSIKLKPYKKVFLSNEELIISSVGRLVWEKGYVYAIDTVFILKQKGYKFKYFIAGDGLDINVIRFHIKRLGLEDNIVLLGLLTKDEVSRLLHKTDIYFQPSVSEALSNSIIEASSFGLPVVSTDIGGIPEVVENNVSGFLHTICSPEKYAESIVELIENKALRIQMGEKGYDITKEKFDRVKELEKWMLIYKM